MITVKSYTIADLAVWDKFVRESRTPMFMFERGFMDYHSDRFEDLSLMVYRDDELMAVLPASRHGTEARSHGGLTYGGLIVGDKMKQHTMLECFDAIKEKYFDLGISNLIYKKIPHFYSTQPCEEDVYALWRGGGELVKCEPSTVVNLKNPYKMPKGRKAQVSRARREGVNIRETDDFELFIALENSVLQEHHGVQAVHTAAELRLLKSRFPENIKCFGSFKDGELIAGILLFIYGTVVHTQYMAANPLAREIGALDLAVSGVIGAYRNSHNILDFGISTENGGQDLNEGLIFQKEGLGGRTIVYQTWEIKI